jgi:hypothetical protein
LPLTIASVGRIVSKKGSYKQVSDDLGKTLPDHQKPVGLIGTQKDIKFLRDAPKLKDPLK